MVLTGCASKPNTGQESTEQKPTVSVSTPPEPSTFTNNAEQLLEKWRLRELELLHLLKH
jgi:hypothetical protein